MKKLILITAIVLVVIGVLLQLTSGYLFDKHGLNLFSACTYCLNYFSAGTYSIGIFSAGTFSIGIFSIGIFSIGIFSIGIFNIGIFAIGIFILGWKKRIPDIFGNKTVNNK